MSALGLALLACAPAPPDATGGTTPPPTTGQTGDTGTPLPTGPTTFVGDVLITGPADLDALATIGVITGDLVVEETALVELALPLLREVGGSVRIWENDQLAEVELTALAEVGGDLSLYDDPLLTSLSGFSALESVGGTLSLNRLEGLTDLQGLNALETIGTDLYVFHDTALVSLAGLDALRSVGWGIQLWELYALEDATFPALETVGAKIDLFDSDQLTTTSFPALVAANAYELHECDRMADVGEFPLLTAMGGAITVKYSDGITTLGGFTALTSVAAIEVHDNAALADPGLPALTSVAEEVKFYYNPSLSQCALEGWFDRVQPPRVVCGGNLDDGCSGWCVTGTAP